MSEQPTNQPFGNEVNLPELKEGQVILGFAEYNQYLNTRRDMVGHVVYLLGMVFATLEEEGVDRENREAIRDYLTNFKTDLTTDVDQEGLDYYRRVCSIISTWFSVPIDENLVLIDDVTVEAYRQLVQESQERAVKEAAEKIEALKQEQSEVSDKPQLRGCTSELLMADEASFAPQSDDVKR